ncbi:MAG: class I SAM-dependent methyltransferase [Chromatiales bacterium]|nr:class I SAM-dependent methyltransferase [Chromatiales bacterium]
MAAETHTHHKHCHREGLHHWLATPLGREVRRQEGLFLEELMNEVFGYYLLQIGSLDWENEPLAQSRVRHRVLIDPGLGSGPGYIQSGFEDLPVATDSVDAVLLPHTLEFADHPHQLLREVDRVLIPEGKLIVLLFNPWGLWAPWRLWLRRKGEQPWCASAISPLRLRDWLSLMGFEVEAGRGLFFRPPFKRAALLNRLSFMEDVGSRWLPPLAAVYAIMAFKRISTLTPIRPRWTPRRSQLAAGLAEPTARNLPHVEN